MATTAEDGRALPRKIPELRWTPSGGILRNQRTGAEHVRIKYEPIIEHSKVAAALTPSATPPARLKISTLDGAVGGGGQSSAAGSVRVDGGARALHRSTQVGGCAAHAEMGLQPADAASSGARDTGGEGD